MERLTVIDDDGCICRVNCKVRDFDVWERLAAYEDTGLTPEEITRLTRDNNTLRNELCERCGLYKEAHNGACDWCRWGKHDV